MTILGVAGRDDLGAIQSFISDLGVDGFPHIVDESGDIWEQLGVVSQPAFIFLDDTGTSTSHLGALGATAISERLDELLSN